MKLKSRTFLILILSALLAVSVWGGYFLFYKYVLSQSAKVDEVVISVAQLTKDQERIIDIKHSVDRTEEDRAFVGSHFYKKDSIHLLLEEIEGYAEDQGATIAITTLGDTEDGLQVVIKSQGSFSSLMNFLVLLEQGPFEMSAEKLFFSKIPETPTWELNATILILTYSN